MQSRQEVPYTLCVAHNYFYMQCLTTNRHFSTILSSSSKNTINNSTNNYLQINRRTNKIKEITKEEYQSRVDEISFTHIIKFYVLLGTIVINHEPYLLVATSVSQIAKYIEYPVYLINDVEFVPYRSKLFQRTEENQEQSKIIDELKRNHINKHFYYSYKENVTSSLAEQQSNQQKIEVFNEFAWNGQILQDFRRCKIHRCWTIPIIQGFVAEIISENKYFSFEYLSISRRSIHMSGTRFNSRGLDEEAHSSNFVQTEEIFKCHNQLYVHVSVRGSVPLFWKQIRVRSNIHYMKDKDIDEQAIIKQHYAQLQSKYSAQVTTINLLSKQKSPEKELKYRFQALFNRNIKSEYLFFDLNEEVKDNVNGQTNVCKFIESNIKAIFGESPFLLLQNITKQPKQFQSMYLSPNPAFPGSTVQIVWIEQTFSWQEQANSLQNQLKNTQDSEANLEEKKIKIGESFMKELINVWTTLGNKISQIYCGTASVASHITKKQNHTIKTFLGGAIISLNRYINANTTDVFKQQCIDCFLGRRGILSTTEYFNANICLNKIKSRDYCKFTSIQINVITFNTNGINITQQGQQSHYHFLKSIDFQASQILVFHLQEVVQSQKWIQILEKELSVHMYSILIYYKFEKSDLLSIVFIRNQQPKKYNYKFLQMIEIPLKSYGALSLFIEINNSIVCLINCKLQSGFENKSLRLDDFNQIHKFLLAQTYKSNLVKLCDFVFLAGDLNLRLSYNVGKEFKFKNLIEEIHNSSLKNDSKQIISEALQYDELPMYQHSKFIEYFEREIDFLPTYKCYSKKAGFDRMKSPAWCDRILFSNGLRSQFKMQQNTKSINCKAYRRIQQNYGSTHKGVLGTFDFLVKQQTLQTKRVLIANYLFP